MSQYTKDLIKWFCLMWIGLGAILLLQVKTGFADRLLPAEATASPAPCGTKDTGPCPQSQDWREPEPR